LLLMQVEVETLALKPAPLTLLLGISFDILLQFTLMTTASKRENYWLFCSTTLRTLSTINSYWKKQHKEATFECMATWWYEANIFFNATHSLYYQHMLDVIAGCVKGFKGPNFHLPRGSLLQNDARNINDELREYKE